MKLLSRGIYDVVLSFESASEELLARLREAAPLRMEVKRSTVELTLRSTEGEVLALLSSLAERWPILNFEVSGASLEDIFLEILARPDSPRDPESAGPSRSLP